MTRYFRNSKTKLPFAPLPIPLNHWAESEFGDPDNKLLADDRKLGHYPLNKSPTGCLEPWQLITGKERPADAHSGHWRFMRMLHDVRGWHCLQRWNNGRRAGLELSHDRHDMWTLSGGYQVPFLILPTGEMYVGNAATNVAARAIYDHLGVSILCTSKAANNGAAIGFSDIDGTEVPEAQLNMHGLQTLVVQNLSGVGVRFGHDSGTVDRETDLYAGAFDLPPSVAAFHQPGSTVLLRSPVDPYPIGGERIVLFAPAPADVKRDRNTWLREFIKFLRAQLLLQPPADLRKIAGNRVENAYGMKQIIDALHDPKQLLGTIGDSNKNLPALLGCFMSSGYEPRKCAYDLMDAMNDRLESGEWPDTHIVELIQQVLNASTRPVESLMLVALATTKREEYGWFTKAREAESLPFIIVRQL